MQNYFALAAPQVNNDLDFSPIQNALENYRLQQRLAQQDKLAAENTQYARSRDVMQDKLAADQRDYQRKIDTRNYQDQKRKDFGNAGVTVANIKDPVQKKIAHDALMRDYISVFGKDGLEPEDFDPNIGPMRIIAHSGISYDPEEKNLDRQLKQSQISKYSAEAEKDRQSVIDAQAKANMVKRLMPNAPNSAPSTIANRPDMQTSATSIEPQNANKTRSTNPIDNMTDDEKNRAAFALTNGDTKAYTEIVEAVNQRVKTSRGVEGVIKNLASLADRFSDDAFANALGPYQGPDPDNQSYFAPLYSAMTGTSRKFGEASQKFNNFFNQNYDKKTGKYTPYSIDRSTGKEANLVELRQEVDKGVSMLSNIIKPLVRLPGDQFTDTDTKGLIKSIGDLSTSTDRAEYKRRLKSTLQLIKDSLQVDIDPSILGEKPPQQMSTPTLKNEALKINSLD